jgi:selenocysteine-specific translation elongation factor
MRHIHVAALEADAELAKKIGKKAGESDFAIYNCKEGDGVLSIYHPSKYPEKVQPLLYSLSLCDVAYIRPASIDKFTGEMIVACAVFGRKLLVIADKVSSDELEPLLKSAGVAQYEFFEGDANALREKLLCEPSLRKEGGKAEVVIDACFPVKGVGTVALGIVQQGKVSVHQKLHFLPSGVSAEVKSIQVQDVDVKEADVGARVGLNLKNLEAETVGRGDVACEEKWACATKAQVSFEPTKFYKGSLESVQFFMLWGIKFVACKAKKSEGGYEMELGSPLPLREGETVVLFLAEAMPRVIGRAKILKA